MGFQSQTGEAYDRHHYLPRVLGGGDTSSKAEMTVSFTTQLLRHPGMTVN